MSDKPTDPIRLALLVHTFDVGGLERCVARLVNHLDRERIEPVVFCLNCSGTAAQWIEKEVEVVELKKKAGNDLRSVFRLGRALKERHIDILHSHNWGTIVEALFARRLAKIPVHIHAQRGMDIPAASSGRLKRLLRRRVFRWALRRADAIFAVAESVGLHLQEISKLGAERISVIPNGVEGLTAADDARRQLRGQLAIRDDQLLIGSVGRLAAVKDFGTAIHSLQRLQSSLDIHLVLVGDGDEESNLRQLAESLGVQQRVHLVGRQTNVGDWLSALDIYVNCSLSEGMSQAILEAMSMGLPFVVTDVGDNGQLVSGDGGCGLVVPKEEPDQLADAVKRMVSEQKLAEFRRNSLQRFQDRYTVHKMVSRYDDEYHRLIAAKGKRRRKV